MPTLKPDYSDLGLIPEASAHDNSDLGLEPEKPMRVMPTEVESALRGAAQGGTFGYSDELEGLGGAINDVTLGRHRLQDVVDRYRANRDIARGKNEQAHEVNPKSYLGGEVAGSLGTAFLPGVGGIGIAKNAASLPSVLAAGAKVGGLTGLGLSNADLTRGEIKDAASDTAKSAATGAAAAGIMDRVIVPGIKALTPENVAKKMSSVFLGTPEETTETYIKNPQGVLNSPRRYEVAKDLTENGIDKLKQETIEGSQRARDILTKEGKTVSSQDLAGIYNAKAQELMDRSEGVMNNPQTLAAYNWLKQNADEMTKADKMFSTNRIKDELCNIDDMVDYEIGPGRFGKVADAPKKQVRTSIDSLLKNESPEYTQQMSQVAKDAQLLDQVSNLSKSPQGLTNLLRRVETDQYGGAQIPKETLQSLDQRLGTDFLNKIKLTNAKEQFDKSVTNGSRNVNLYSNMLKDSSIPGAKFIAPVIGATVDKYGRKFTMSAVDAASKLNSVYQTEGAQKFMQQMTPVINAAKSGDANAALIYQLLRKSNPDALKNLDLEEEK